MGEDSPILESSQCESAKSMHRRNFILRLSLSGSAAAIAPAMSDAATATDASGPGNTSVTCFRGLGEVQSEKGFSAYRVATSNSEFEIRLQPPDENGSVASRIHFISLTILGQRVAGPSLGPFQLTQTGTIEGPLSGTNFEAAGNLVFRSDTIGELLTAARLQGTIAPATQVIELMRIDASAPGLHGEPLAVGIIAFEY
jgi:hypothetical protein